MPPDLALIIGFLFIGVVFSTERHRKQELSPAIFLVFLWAIVSSTRPVGVWLDLWGFPVIGSTDPTEGSIYDRLFYGPLALIGLIILIKRRTEWGDLIQKNRWFIILFAFMAISILWSSFPTVSFKRWVKAMGTVVMALLVLTAKDRCTSASCVIRWTAYLHIPLSIIMIKYFRHIGVDWNDYSGEASWVGLATSKNTLGQVAAISALYFLWDWKTNAGQKIIRLISFVYILMSLYLLKGAEDSISITSLSVFGMAFVLWLGMNWVKHKPSLGLRIFKGSLALILAFLVLLIIHSLVNFGEKSILGKVIGFLGRDITITGRTEIWNDIFKVASQSPLVGVGYGAFWIGRIANIPWTENVSWTLGQGHNGYVDVYLQLGWIGVFLLMAFLFSSASAIGKSFLKEGDFCRLRMILFLVVLFVNITESTFLRGDHYLWLVFLMAALSLPYGTSIKDVKPFQPAIASKR